MPHELSQDEDDSQTTRVEATDIEKGKERERPIGNLRRQTTAKDFIVGFEGPNDPLNARNWPFRKKAYVVRSSSVAYSAVADLPADLVRRIPR